MKAGLITGVESRVELEKVIDDAYMSIFGVSFKDENNVSLDTPEVLDVPTCIRRNC